jgi:hypothetical protein
MKPRDIEHLIEQTTAGFFRCTCGDDFEFTAFKTGVAQFRREPKKPIKVTVNGTRVGAKAINDDATTTYFDDEIALRLFLAQRLAPPLAICAHIEATGATFSGISDRIPPLKTHRGRASYKIISTTSDGKKHRSLHFWQSGDHVQISRTNYGVPKTHEYLRLSGAENYALNDWGSSEYSDPKTFNTIAALTTRLLHDELDMGKYVAQAQESVLQEAMSLFEDMLPGFSSDFQQLASRSRSSAANAT